MRIAIIGYGGVGKAFTQLINNKREYLYRRSLEIQVNYIINSSGGIYNSQGIDCSELIEFLKWEKDITKYKKGGSEKISLDTILQNNDIDMAIEVTSTNKKTGEPGMTHIRKCLENGIHVVTANKGPILLAYKELKDLALRNGVGLGVGCTAGGALPSINGGLIDLAGAEIISIAGVLNGTTNFIINEMEHKAVSYLEALKKAQELGIAEFDASLDVEGWDTASKLLILTNILMDEEKILNDITIEGITEITKEEVMKCLQEGKKYKLLGRTVKESGRINMSVKLEKLDITHPLYGVDGKNKGVTYKTDVLGDLTIIGGASGVISAAASILRDIINISKEYRTTKKIL